MAGLVHVVGLVQWNPEIRNILALLVGVGILVGSVALLISSNTGPRTGVLITLAAVLGWMTIMGMIWWLFSGSPASLGGLKGTPAHWRVLDVNVGNLAADPLKQAQQLPAVDDQQLVAQILAKHPDLEAKVNPDHVAGKVITTGDLIDSDPALVQEYHLTPGDLAGWHILPTSDKQRGDAQAIADAELGPDGQKIYTSSAGYKVINVYDIGGKENEHPLPANASMWDRVWQNIVTAAEFSHPPHYIIVQVQGVIHQDTPPGGAPPTPKLDPAQPIVSVVMVRSLGDVRFPGFMTMVCCGVLFALVCNTLHRRDKAIMRNRAAVG